jgi:hypothetical protein
MQNNSSSTLDTTRRKKYEFSLGGAMVLLAPVPMPSSSAWLFSRCCCDVLLEQRRAAAGGGRIAECHVERPGGRSTSTRYKVLPPLDCVDGRGGGVCVGRQEGGPQHATRSDHDVASSTQQRALAYGPRLHASLAWVWRT